MPFVVHKHGTKWAIVNKDTGKVAGYSGTKTKAKKSAAIRNRGHGSR